jgi:hypothetical protein
MRIRWSENSFTGTSYVMLSANICTESANATIAPSSDSRGTNRRTAASSSIDPAKRSYAGDAPIDAHSTPIGEKLP